MAGIGDVDVGDLGYPLRQLVAEGSVPSVVRPRHIEDGRQRRGGEPWPQVRLSGA